MHISAWIPEVPLLVSAGSTWSGCALAIECFPHFWRVMVKRPLSLVVSSKTSRMTCWAITWNLEGNSGFFILLGFVPAGSPFLAPGLVVESWGSPQCIATVVESHVSLLWWVQLRVRETNSYRAWEIFFFRPLNCFNVLWNLSLGLPEISISHHSSVVEDHI